MDYKKVAREIYDKVGKRENLVSAAHCATRLRLVLADNAMPKLKGTDLIRQIRQCRPTLPTILITGYADQEVLRMRREGWIDETLNKPLDFARLADAMEKLLRREEEA